MTSFSSTLFKRRAAAAPPCLRLASVGCFALRRTSLATTLLCMASVAGAQTPPGTVQPPSNPAWFQAVPKTAGPIPGRPGDPSLLPSDAHVLIDAERGNAAPATPSSLRTRPDSPLAPATLPRAWVLEPSVTTRVTATDNARLDNARKNDVYLEVMPRLSVRTQGPRHRLNAMLGADHLSYQRDSYSSRTDPVANASLNSVLIENALFLDAAALIDRRAPSPFSSQGAYVDTSQKVRTQVYTLSPYLQMQPVDGIRAGLRSDNTWTRRSGSGVNTLGSNVDKVYSMNTSGRLEREARPLGAGIEFSSQALRYNDLDDVLRIENALVSLSYAFDPQFTVSMLGGRERNKFSNTPNSPTRTQTDSDVGARIRWTPLERSTLTAEARKRFFGTSYKLQWNHRSPFMGVVLGATREPYTAPNSMRLAGDVAGQFDAIFRARGFDAAQRQLLVRDTLLAYGLPDSLTDPVNLYFNRAQLASTANVEVTLLGRRTVAVLSAYKRRLEQLQRAGDPAALSVFDLGDLDQTGGQAAITFKVTPMLSLEATYRHDRSQGLGFNSAQLTKENLVSIGASVKLSPRTRLNFGVQQQQIESTVGGRPPSAEANSAAIGMTHRF